MVPSVIMFHCGASVFLGSLVFLGIDFRAKFFFFKIIFVVLSPIEKCISDGEILRGEFSLSVRFSESSESILCGEALGVASVLY